MFTNAVVCTSDENLVRGRRSVAVTSMHLTGRYDQILHALVAARMKKLRWQPAASDYRGMD